MKNKIIILAGLLFALCTSCKKDRSCVCTTTTVYDKVFSPSTDTQNYTYKKTTRKEIKTLCKSYKREFAGGTTTSDCTLK